MHLCTDVLIALNFEACCLQSTFGINLMTKFTHLPMPFVMEMKLKVSCTVTVPILYMKKMQSLTHQSMLIIIVKSLQLISLSFSVKSNCLSALIESH